MKKLKITKKQVNVTLELSLEELGTLVVALGKRNDREIKDGACGIVTVLTNKEPFADPVVDLYDSLKSFYEEAAE